MFHFPLVPIFNYIVEGFTLGKSWFLVNLSILHSLLFIQKELSGLLFSTSLDNSIILVLQVLITSHELTHSVFLVYALSFQTYYLLFDE